ncbi:MAG: YihY/virulence factor BrkB family protein [Bacteriovoracaceae bacterium]
MVIYLKSLFVRSASIFIERNLPLVAAGSSFFLMLTIIPFIILLMKTAGLFFLNISGIELKIFELLKTFLPETSPELLSTFQQIIQKALLRKSGQDVYISIVFLSLGSLSLFGSLSKGLELIKEKKNKATLKKIEDLFFVGISVVFAIACLTLPAVLDALYGLMNNITVLSKIESTFPELLKVFSVFKYLKSGQYLFPIILWLYITFLLSWYFRFKLRKRDFLLISLFFLLTLNMAKWLFIIYIKTVSQGMVSNYGGLYTYILAMLWIYLVMIAFYFSACLCQAKIQMKGIHGNY